MYMASGVTLLPSLSCSIVHTDMLILLSIKADSHVTLEEEAVGL